MKRIYLDHTATTPLDPRVLESMLPFFSGNFGNASSIHWYGQRAKRALDEARGVIADAIGAQPAELFFTSGGTESDNLALKGVASAARKKYARPHIITSKAEHHAVLETSEWLVQEGCEATVLPVDQYGLVSADEVQNAITGATCLVSIMTANNEVGSVYPIAEIASAVHDKGIPLHSDAVQALGRLSLDVNASGVDLLTLSAHKIYGPKGIGALFIRKGTAVDPLLQGGGQERGKRPGTENVPLAVGFAKAVELAVAEMDEETRRLQSLREELEAGIRSRIPAVVVNGHPVLRLPHVLNVSIDGNQLPIEGEMLLMNLDLRGIAVTSGSACTSGSMQPSHVLLAMGRDMRTAKATLRFAFGRTNTREDVAYVLDALQEVVQQMTG